MSKGNSKFTIPSSTFKPDLPAPNRQAGFYLSEDGEWVPDGWKISKLGDYIKEIAMGPFGSNLKVDMFTESGVPVIKGQNLATRYVSGNHSYVSEEKADRLRRSVAYRNDFIVTHRGTIGQVSLIRGNRYKRYVTSQSQLRFNVDDEVLDNEFLLSWFHTPRGQHELLRNSSQVGVPSIASPTSSVKDINIIRPPLPEQNETLEALAQTLFKRWFVDFNFPDENGNPYKDFGGSIDELEETSLDTFIELNPIEKIDRQREYLFFDMKCLPLNQLSLSTGIFKSASSATSFREGDTLLAKITPCLENGKTGLVLDLKGEQLARGSTEFIVMRPKPNGSKCFNYCLVRSSKFRDYAIRSMSGSSGRQRVPVDRVKSYSVINKPELIRYFETLLAPNFNKIKVNTQQIEILTHLRDTLLPKLMKGEVRISEADQKTEEDLP